jgi:hypothetical protein
MIVRCTVAAACLAIAACVARPAPDTAALPFAAFGTMDNDVAAVNQAAGHSPPRRALRTIQSMPPVPRPPSTIWRAPSPAIRAG